MQITNSVDLWIKDFPKPQANDNKYDHGHVVVVGANIKDGSTGATKLAALSALRSGAGLVSIICDKETAPIYAASMLSVMVKIIDTEAEFDSLLEDKRVTSVLIGPGNGVSLATKHKVLQALRHKKNVVLDADAITVFQDNPSELFDVIFSEVVMTPHEGEFTRLFTLGKDKVASVLAAASLSKATILLKGQDSIIASANGDCVINKAAPVTLATAGSGDVLAGLIAGFVAQGVNSFTSSCIANYIHCEAAKLFGDGLISQDLIDQIPKLIKRLHNHNI